MNRTLLVVAGVVGFGIAAVVGCQCRKKARPAPTPEPTVVQELARGSGVIEGRVEWRGKAPVVQKLRTTPECPNGLVNEQMIVATDGGMANVVVRLTGVRSALPAPTAPLVLDQIGCRYQPHVRAVHTAQPLRIQTSDAMLHNVHVRHGKTSVFSIGQAPNAKPIDHAFKNAGEYRFNCDVHPWMTAWVVVVDHPFFSVTAADGSFRITGLPAGTYAVEAWHEKAGAQTTTVTVVEEGMPARARFAFTPR